MTTETYLTAKRTVDDRAIDERVFDAFRHQLSERGEREQEPVRILEVGVGTGTMIPRLADWDGFTGSVEYHGVDRNQRAIRRARNVVPAALRRRGYDVSVTDSILARSVDHEVEITFANANVFDQSDSRDVVIASAFLDLVDLPDGLEKLLELLDGGGVLYAPITFDGLTGFVPAHPLDDRIVGRYHQHMRDVRQRGGPNAGRRLLDSVRTVDATVLAAGGSDWLIRPRETGYPHREKLVLEYLLETIVDAVHEVDAKRLSRTDITDWEASRRTQLQRGELTYLAHNLDILVKC